MNVVQEKEGGSIQVMTCTGRGVIRRQRGQPIAGRGKGSGERKAEVGNEEGEVLEVWCRWQE